MYLDRLRSGTKAQNIFTKNPRKMQIGRETLRGWKRDGHWVFKANVEVLPICKNRFYGDFAKAAGPADTQKRSGDATY